MGCDLLGDTAETADVTVSNSTFTNNDTGILIHDPATGRTRGNNTVGGNTTDVDGVLTPLPGM